MPRINLPTTITAFTAEGAAVAHQAVSAGTADTQVDCTPAAGAQCIGITLGAAADGEQVDVILAGPCLAIAAGVIPRSSPVEIDGVTGRVVAFVPASGAGTAAVNLVGYALEAAAGAGEVISINLQPGFAAK